MGGEEGGEKEGGDEEGGERKEERRERKEEGLCAPNINFPSILDASALQAYIILAFWTPLPLQTYIFVAFWTHLFSKL